jgi:hypothetical protein
MFQVLQITTIFLVAVGVTMSLAHALEMPGKLRLDRQTYLAVQTIYYPGFTVGGVFGEFGAMLATLTLLILTPSGTTAFWLVLAALIVLLVMHAVYWLWTHPANKVWLREQKLHGAGAAFFNVGGKDEGAGATEEGWTAVRDRWERSHLVRSVLVVLAFLALVTAATL